MAERDRAIVGPCPNTRCRKVIWNDHDDPWCYKCGEYFPDEFAAKLPKLITRKEASGRSVDEVPSSEFMKNAQPRARAVMRRYHDAYRVARMIDRAGGTIKVIGALLAAVFTLIGLIVASQFGAISFFLGLIPAVVIGLLCWLNGVLVSAQGQLLLASVDGVVSISPFLKEDEKAEVMTLPRNQD